MFTQCSKCETVFRLSAEVLRRAGGQVRCGKCGEVFNALARLAEEPAAFGTAEGGSALDLETRADEILGSAPAPPPQQPRGDDDPEGHFEFLEVEDWELDPTAVEGASLEFTLPPGDLDRIFVENRGALKFLAEAAAESRVSRTDAVPPKRATASDAPAADFGAAHEAAEPESDADFADAGVPEEDAPAILRAGRRGDRAATALPSINGQELSERVRREVQDGIAQANRPVFPEEPRRTSATGWVAAALFGAALLAAQLVHQNRDWLATQEPLGGPLRNLYAAMGAPITMPPNLSVYQLRQWGVTGDPGADGTLRVRASILNVAGTAQPYPELRVTLADRFGNRIGNRDFEPGEYLARPPAKLMAPGERADATLEIQDPGRSAEGFEFDVCLRSAEQRVLCANDALARPR